MIRTFVSLFTVTVLAATLLVSRAEACISCEYVPQVVHTPNPNDKAKQQKMRASKAVKQRSAPKKQIVKRTKPVPKPVDTAKTAPATTTSEAVPKETAQGGADETVSTAKLDGSADANEEIPQGDASGSGDCKKFSATAGTTVSVPCE